MEMYTFDPKKGRNVFAGNFDNGVYTREVTAAHFMRKFQSYAIQEEIIQKLIPLGCRAVVFKTPDGVIECSFSDWLLPSIRVIDYGHGKQRFLPLRYFHKQEMETIWE